jgi:hypothetical protein
MTDESAVAKSRSIGAPPATAPFMLRGLREEWHQFKDDPPGERFQRHERRAERRSWGHRALRIALGAVLLGGGIFLLFVPGPGLLVMLFGLTLFAGESRWIAAQMDRGELWLRPRWERVRAWWRRKRKRRRGDATAS